MENVPPRPFVREIYQIFRTDKSEGFVGRIMMRGRRKGEVTIKSLTSSGCKTPRGIQGN